MSKLPIWKVNSLQLLLLYCSDAPAATSNASTASTASDTLLLQAILRTIPPIKEAPPMIVLEMMMPPIKDRGLLQALFKHTKNFGFQ